MKKLNTGSKIPGFELPDQHGHIFNINKVLGKKNLVIYFYPKDETPGCTAEACSFRDHYEDFLKAGAEVIGISSDPPEAHRNFARKHNLPFILLSDVNKSIRKLFGVPNDLMGLVPGRVTYVIDKKGIIRYVFRSQLNAEKHVSNAIAELNKLD